jgi:hypothetical protein
MELGEGITLVFLVCEDLAQNDGLADVLRSVAPTIVFAPLLDGPQLASRWAARYASVLADDPGSAVITLTSFGMVERSRPPGHDASRVIGLWKDPARGIRDIPLEPGAHGVLLSVCADRASRRTIDGRRPIENCTDFFDVGVYQIRASSEETPSQKAPSPPLEPHALETLDLSILTGWAEALADALAHEPSRAEQVVAEAHADAGWRQALGIAQPSLELGKAIESIDRAVRDATPAAGTPTFDAVLKIASSPPSSEERLETLARRVLRSALEQRLTRRASESVPASSPASRSGREAAS